MEQEFNKEAWMQQKQQDRETAYGMVDDALGKLGTDAGVFQSYLDVQARFDRYSVSNALLVASQKPDATELASANVWRNRGGYIQKSQSGIYLLEPGKSYNRKDGSPGVNINVKKVFDISQTTLIRKKTAAVHPDMRLLLSAMVKHAPCKVDFRDTIPGEKTAFYSAAEKTVFVQRGMPLEETFRCLSQELAHAYMDTGSYDRKACAFPAYCASYLLCQRNGIATEKFSFEQLPEHFAMLDSKALRDELGKIRTAANQITADMNRSLENRSRQKEDAR